MVELKAFKPNGKTCNWPGCCNEAVDTTLPVVSKTMHCIKHHLRKMSGRVGTGWTRDHYREHLKSVCAISGARWGDVYKSVKLQLEYINIKYNLNKTYTRLELVRRTCQQFDVDHDDGNHYNNDPSNLQTLLKTSHKLKTDAVGDANPTRYKKND